MSTSDRIARELADLQAGRSQPDLQMDVLDSELPTLDGELDTTRNQEEAEYIDALQGLRELQSGDPVRWKVWRIDNPAGDRRLNGYCSPELGTAELTMENIARRWGGGKYRIRGTFSNGKFAGGKTVDIAGDVKAVEQSSVSPTQFTPPSNFDMQAFLAMQSMQDAKREERQSARFDRMLALILPVAGQIVSAIVGRAAPAQPDLAGLITALRPTVAPPDPMDQMKKMAETMAIMQKFSGGDGDSFSSIATALAPYAGPVLGALASRPTAPAPMVSHRPAPMAPPARVSPPITATATPVVPAPPTHTGVNLDAPSQPISQDQQAMFAQLKPQIDTLVQMARENADPITTAEVFFDQVITRMNDDMYNTVADIILDPHALEKIAIFNTGVKQYAVFFEAFHKKLIEKIQADSQSVA